MKLLFRYISLTLLLPICLFGCQPETQSPPTSQNPSPKPDSISYLALGDSYTIGESVAEDMRWPVQLAVQLRNEGMYVLDPKIIARTGWTTDELAAAIATENPSSDYDLVSLLIGVNNQFRGYPFSQYETEFVQLLETVIAQAGGRGDKVFVVSIPDYGVTPFGQTRDTAKIARELDEYNAYAAEVCANRGIPFFDITPISRKALDQPELVAPDNLHPSGEMYRQWVELMKGGVKTLAEKE